MKTWCKWAAVVVMLLSQTLWAVTDEQQQLIVDAQQTLERFVKEDPSLAEAIGTAPGYVVFSQVGKGGFIVGGAHGKGILFADGAATDEVALTQVNIGLQAGAQSYAELIVFEDAHTLNRFREGNFELGAQVSAVAAAAGRSADAPFEYGVKVFTLQNKGLMVEASVGGQKFKVTALTTDTNNQL